jgi:hypothetical protein
MHLNRLQQKLIAAARANPPAANVPYAFEKRVMALLRSAPVLDAGALWARALWRSAAGCLALALLLGVLTHIAPAPAPSKDLSQEFEKTMLAAVDQDNSIPW